MADEKGFSDQDLLEALRAWARERGLKPGQYQEPTLDKTSGRLFWGKIKLPPGLTMEMLRESAKKIAASKGVASTDIGAAPAGEIPYTQQEIIDVIKNWVKRNFSGWDQRAALDRLLPSKVDPFTGRPTMAFTVEGTDWSKVGAPEGMNDPRLMRSILKYRTEGIPAAAPTGGLSSAAGAAVAGEGGGPTGAPAPGGMGAIHAGADAYIGGGPPKGEDRPPVIDFDTFVAENPSLAIPIAIGKPAYLTQTRRASLSGAGPGEWPLPDLLAVVTFGLEAMKTMVAAGITLPGQEKVVKDPELHPVTIQRGGKQIQQWRRYNPTLPEGKRMEVVEEVEVGYVTPDNNFTDVTYDVKLGDEVFLITKRLFGISVITPELEGQIPWMKGAIIGRDKITPGKPTLQFVPWETDDATQLIAIDPTTGKIVGDPILTTKKDKSGQEVTIFETGTLTITRDTTGKVTSKIWELSPEGENARKRAEANLQLTRERLDFEKEQAREAQRQAGIAQLTDAWNSAEAFSIEWARLGGEARTKSQAALNKFMTVGPGGPKGWAELVEGLRQQKAADIYDTRVEQLEEWKATLPSPLEGQISQAIAAGAAGKGQIAPAGPGLPGTNIAQWAPNITPQMMAGRPQPPQVSFPQLPGNIPEPTALGVQTGDIDVVMRNWLAQNPTEPWFGQPQPWATGFWPTGFPRREPTGELSRMGAGGGGQTRRTFIR